MDYLWTDPSPTIFSFPPDPPIPQAVPCPYAPATSSYGVLTHQSLNAIYDELSLACGHSSRDDIDISDYSAPATSHKRSWPPILHHYDSDSDAAESDWDDDDAEGEFKSEQEDDGDVKTMVSVDAPSTRTASPVPTHAPSSSLPCSPTQSPPSLQTLIACVGNLVRAGCLPTNIDAVEAAHTILLKLSRRPSSPLPDTKHTPTDLAFAAASAKSPLPSPGCSTSFTKPPFSPPSGSPSPPPLPLPPPAQLHDPLACDSCPTIFSGSRTDNVKRHRDRYAACRNPTPQRKAQLVWFKSQLAIQEFYCRMADEKLKRKGVKETRRLQKVWYNFIETGQLDLVMLTKDLD